MPKAYYNEINLYCAEWLYNLQKENLIAPGDIDTRPIQDVRPNDLKGYTQHHFFAGIGGWSCAARLAGWPDELSLWTGSCPCQPFSDAGGRKGFDDARHLWPHWFRLIAQCKPSIVVGEQVASRLGREWLAGIQADVETLDAAFAAADLCAAGVGAPHIRQRLYWLAYADGANASAEWKQPRGRFGQLPAHGTNFEGLGISEGEQRHGTGAARNGWGKSSDASLASERVGEPESESERQCRQPWQQSEAVECDDGWRRIEPGAQPLAHGIQSRLDKISGYGNAIVPQVGAAFLESVMEILQ